MAERERDGMVSRPGGVLAENGGNVWTAESCLRRGLEASLDVGRHILAKGLGLGVSEYKEIAPRLQERGILQDKEADLLRVLAGYRNRLVHFYRRRSRRETTNGD